MNSIQSFVDRCRELLRLEKRAEIDEARRLREGLSVAELERRGLCLDRLRLADLSAGVGGRALARLERSRGGPLGAHSFQPGDIVVLRDVRGGAGAEAESTGVVYRLKLDAVIVALDGDPWGDERRGGVPDLVRIERVANDVTYRRMDAALGALLAGGRGPSARLREILFGLRDLPAIEAPPDFAALDLGLDASQRRAAAFAANAGELALIHGPPGTGKTTTLVEVIRQAVARREKTLACAASNIAVDNLVERLAARGLRVVRIGHPARLLPTVEAHALDNLIESSEGARIALDVRRDIDRSLREVRRSRDREERRRIKNDLDRLRAELRELEARTLRDILAGADVVLATCSGAASDVLDDTAFDLIVIDEAAQALEPACWIPLLRGRRAVLAGDHLQLAPTLHSREAERGGLGVTLFDRAIRKWGDAVARRITVQYRMHETIMRWSSEALYDGELVAHESVKAHRLVDLAGVAATDATAAPFVFIDTAGCGLEETLEEGGDSRLNEGEAKLVESEVRGLLAAGVAVADIAVITPYNAQVGLLRRRLADLRPGLEIDTVDGFQGREKEAVVLSLVRSNRKGEVGFLADERRLNVAVTRARRHITVIGDSATVSAHPFLEGLVAYCQERAVYRTAWELL